MKITIFCAVAAAAGCGAVNFLLAVSAMKRAQKVSAVLILYFLHMLVTVGGLAGIWLLAGHFEADPILPMAVEITVQTAVIVCLTLLRKKRRRDQK